MSAKVSLASDYKKAISLPNTQSSRWAFSRPQGTRNRATECTAQNSCTAARATPEARGGEREGRPDESHVHHTFSLRRHPHQRALARRSSSTLGSGTYEGGTSAQMGWSPS
ncbi:hypothetical protein ColTof4_03494 [Colletotrichum tofieldiae]|nr:hypothetical protein ColTof3_13080 [Colletotrichum tofieldiae]GKT71071.1 hypothetical protein ColTof4_03494 [Colletotrichum tofieldiae]